MNKPEIIEEKDKLKNLVLPENGSVPSMTVRQSPIILNNDMKYFKNELLKELKKMSQELFSKFTQYSMELNEKVKKVSHENSELDNKIEFISKSVENKFNNFLGEKNKYNLDKMLNEIRETKITNEIKIKAMREDLRIHKDHYDDLVRNNILYQGMIGPGCKYKNMHQFIDYLIASLNELTSINNQKAGEMKSYKNKTDNIIHNINCRINELNIEYKSFVKQSIKDFDVKIKNEIKLYDDKLFELRTQSVQNAKNIEKKLDTYDDKYKTLHQIENTINESNGKIIDDLKESNVKLKHMLEEYKKELDELKDHYNELLESHNKIQAKLFNSNITPKRTIINYRNEKGHMKSDSKAKNDYANNDIYKSSEIEIGNKKYKNQSTETIPTNQNKREKKVPTTKEIFTPKSEIPNVYLKMDKDSNNKKVSKKIFKNERLEKFKFLYENDANMNDNNILNKSLDNEQTVNDENSSMNKFEKRIKSSLPLYTKKTKKKKFIENYSSRDLYETGLFVNFNSKDEEDVYINNLKSNALCLKLLEKGIKIDKIYYNDYINKSAINPGDYFYSSKNFVKEKIPNSRKIGNMNNLFNKSFNKRRNSKFENDKFNEYIQKGENDSAFLLKNNNDSFMYRSQNNKIKIKNLSAIE